MNVLTLDFETTDPYLSKPIDLGAGWVYGCNVPNHLFRILGVSLKRNNEPSVYLEFQEGVEWITALKETIERADLVVMHNAQYDLGCLEFLGIPTRNIKVYDTLIVSKLYNNTLYNYSLDNLGKLWVGDHKAHDGLVQVVIDHKFLTQDPKTKTFAGRALKWAKSHMAEIQKVRPDIMAKYACQDTDLTYSLYTFLSSKVPEQLALKFSRMTNACVAVRKKGIFIDLKVLDQGIEELAKDVESLSNELKLALNAPDINLNSNQQLTAVFKELGYDLPKTENDGDSIPKEWLLEHEDDPLCKLLFDYRMFNKLYTDSFVKTKESLLYTCPEALVEGATVGKVYPELNILAARTGRFSSSHPNIQQVSKNKSKSGLAARSLYVPASGKSWCSIDWANQEGRLQVHYAAKIKATGVKLLVSKFQINPNIDLHQEIADMVGITRKQAKGVNLGLSYGMGIPKLAKVLKTSTGEAETIKDNYNTKMPFLQALSDATKKAIKTNGRIMTLGGRALLRESAIIKGKLVYFDYKALNKLIQGSAADMCYLAFLEAWEIGLDVLACVHDEIIIQYTNYSEVLLLEEIMNNVYSLTVPITSDVEVGTSWGDLKEFKITKESRG